MRQHTVVDKNFIRPSRRVPCVRHLFACSPKALWAALLDPESWPTWLPITKVTWTSPAPFGLGTTRTVEGPSGAISELFHEWVEGPFTSQRAICPCAPLESATTSSPPRGEACSPGASGPTLTP